MPIVTLNPIRDSYKGWYSYGIQTGPSDTVAHGKETILKTGRKLDGWVYYPGMGPIFYTETAVMHFDFSALRNVKINSMKLRLYVVNASGADSISLIGLAPSLWSCDEYQSIPVGTYAENTLYNQSLNSSKIGTWLEIDSAYLGSPNLEKYTNSYGIEVMGQTATDTAESFISFASREYADQTKIPQLIIDYSYIPPNAPTNLYPGSGLAINIAEAVRFTWKHNPAYTGEQSKFDLQWRKQGTTTWTAVNQLTANQFYDFAANTFTRGYIEWQVRTYDQNNLDSPWSSIALFYVAQKPAAPVITNPTNNAQITNPLPSISWTSTEQADYNLQVLDNSNTVVWEKLATSQDKSKQIEYSLFNNSTYKIKLRIKNADNYWSDFAQITITTKYTDPPKPAITLQCDTYRGSIKISINNPASTGSQPVIIKNELYRRKKGSSDWMSISSSSPVNGTYIDYSPEYNTEYEYKVRSIGANTAFIESDIKTASTVYANTQIMLISDPTKWVDLVYNPDRRKKKQYEGVSMKFAGRKKRTMQFGEHIDTDLDMSFEIYDKAKLDFLEIIADKQETVIYRDTRGRSLYAVVTDLTATDEWPDYWTVSFNLMEVDYVEGL